MSWRLSIGVLLVTLAATPLAVMWWLLRSVGRAIERMNP
jgi:hypothetical protein